MNISSLRSLLPAKGQGLKKIHDRYYLYEQTWQDGKLTSKCLGQASEEQIGLLQNKARARVIKWIYKNEAMFLEGLKLLAELRATQLSTTKAQSSL